MTSSLLVDGVKIVVNSTGTGALALGAAVPSFRGIEALINGSQYSYAIQVDGDFEWGTGTYLSSGPTLTRSPIWSSNGGAPIDLSANAQVSFVALAEDLYGPSYATAAQAAAEQAAADRAQADLDAQQTGEDRAAVEAAAGNVASGQAVYGPAYASALPQGVTALSNAGVGTGSGGTPGTYQGGVSGGPSGFAWTYTIGSDGKIASYAITNKGLAANNTALTLSYPSGSIAGATVPVATVSVLIADQQTYWVASSDGSVISLYGNNAGSLATAPFGSVQSVLYSKTGVDDVVDALEMVSPSFFESRLAPKAQSTILIDTKRRIVGTIAMQTDLVNFGKAVFFESRVTGGSIPSLLDAKNRVLSYGGSGGGSTVPIPSGFLDAKALPKTAIYGEQRLRRTRMKLRRLKAGVPGTIFRALVIGDSWVQSGVKWGRNYAQYMWTTYGKNASGFFPADNSAALDTLLVVNASGTWVGNNDRSAFYPTPDMINRRSSTVGDAVSIVADAALGIPSAIKLFFTGTADGQIQYRYGASGAWSSSVNVQGVGNTVIYTVPTLPTASGWTLQFRVAAGTVSFGGGYVDGAGDGVRLDFAGFGGTTAAHWITPNATQWEAGITDLNPDLIIILLGTNDKLAGVDATTFSAQELTLAQRCRAAIPANAGVPQADLMVALPTNIGSAGDAIGEAYAQAVFALADANDFAVFTASRVFGPSEADYSAWMTDANHIDPATGGWLFTDWVLKATGA